MPHERREASVAENRDMFATIRKALGRTERLKSAPVPPPLSEPLIRLVHSDVGLPELFVRQATVAGMNAQGLRVEELTEQLIAYLNEKGCKTIALPVSPLLDRIGLPQTLRNAGFDARRWDEMSVDELYDFDCGVTDVWAAVAETGSLVVRAAPEHGRTLSLVPWFHVAIVEPKNIVPDLYDLFERIGQQGPSSGTTLITGPSKTSDIEGKLVTGVHGPGVVKVFVLQ